MDTRSAFFINNTAHSYGSTLRSTCGQARQNKRHAGQIPFFTLQSTLLRLHQTCDHIHLAAHKNWPSQGKANETAPSSFAPAKGTKANVTLCLFLQLVGRIVSHRSGPRANTPASPNPAWNALSADIPDAPSLPSPRPDVGGIRFTNPSTPTTPLPLPPADKPDTPSKSSLSSSSAS
ncbi:unnamed protein product, partial [Ectocarpus sp. 4 AP-2014]